MKISGFVKNSFVDYPGKIASVVFTPGCNMDCPFCHNRHLIRGIQDNIDESGFFSHLDKRKSLVDAVVITGGEPTLQEDLTQFCENVKERGFLLKLDTNGTNPSKIKELAEKGLLDYIAMDIKAPYGKYSKLSGADVDIERIVQSVDILKKCGIDHEFRTTFAPMLDIDDIVEISKIAGESKFFLQQYREANQCGSPHKPDYVRLAAEEAKKHCKDCQIRGL